MADYKELLRRAVEALPENNGAARRAVYEKARAALVGQLRAINPPLAARDITAHRLQLEDCIRQVEQEASEAVIAGLGGLRDDDPPPPPVYFEPPAKKALPGVAKPVAKAPPTSSKEPPRPLPAGDSIEEIIAAANAEHVDSVPDTTRSVSRPETKPMGRPVPKLVPQPRGAAAAAAESRARQDEVRRDEQRREEARREEQRRDEQRREAERAEREREEEARREEIRLEEIRVEEQRREDARREEARLLELRREEQRREEQRREEQKREEPRRRETPRREEPRREEPRRDDAYPDPGAMPSAVDRVVPTPIRTTVKPPVGRPLPSIVARAEAAKSRTSNAAFGAPADSARRAPAMEARRDVAGPRFEPAARGQQQVARKIDPAPALEDEPIMAAMSSVREVDLETDQQGFDPQGAIDRAIATLDREAQDVEETYVNGAEMVPTPDEPVEPRKPRRNAPAAKAETIPVGRVGRDSATAASAADFAHSAKDLKTKSRSRRGKTRGDDVDYASSRREEKRGPGAVTIFLVVFAVLLAGAGGAGFWAWREGYVNLDTMFGRAASVTEQASAPAAAGTGAADSPATGPGNSATPTDDAVPTAELKPGDRLASDSSVAGTQALPIVDTGKSDDRLNTDAAPGTAAAAVAAIDPAQIAGSQSLLLEAQENGTTGAVPFSGTVDWSKGVDEYGLPTLIGKANIPARNMGVDVLIRKNSDSKLPASHVMEITFKVNDGFIGGSIARLPGVLLKNEELVQGTPLVGASARIVTNQFLFALNASPEDLAANTELLTSRKWIDLALIYATGKRAIITLEKDDAAKALFTEVVGAWNAAAAAGKSG